ncbi:17419_t:CDS:1, partial [Dentiscutata heterogama]
TLINDILQNIKDGTKIKKFTNKHQIVALEQFLNYDCTEFIS